jgi:hypothetical protein
MDGVDPWRDGSLVNAGRSAAKAFEAVESRARDDRRWRWLCLAPHAFAAGQGLFGQLKSQMLKQFPHEFVAGLELADQQLPDDAHRGRGWLAEGMAKYHHALYHASDAYILNADPTSTELFEIGSRTTMFKMAEPTIEALRQAFLAADSRIRLTLARSATGHDLSAGQALEAVPLRRPWLREISITGGTSFFGGQANGTPFSTSIRLNPDLTCVIGGRMAGKSTLLDGLRVAFDFPMPIDEQVSADVQGRGRERFLSGSPAIAVDICGPADPTANVNARWPAVFFTQRELQQAITDQAGLRDLLFQLVPGQGEVLRGQFAEIASLARSIRRAIPDLTRAIADVGDADQALSGADAAKAGLERHERVGAGRLSTAQADVGRLRATAAKVDAASDLIQATVAGIDIPASVDLDTPLIAGVLSTEAKVELAARADAVRASLAETAVAVAAYKIVIDEAATAGQQLSDQLRAEIEAALVAGGGTAEELSQFVALSATAQEHEQRRIRAEAARQQLAGVRDRLAGLWGRLSEARANHREAMRTVVETIATRFEEKVRVLVQEDGVDAELEAWVHTLKERGVTRWWNDRSRVISPATLLDAADQDDLAAVGMSDQVAETFASALTEFRRWELCALNTPDRYVLQLLVGPGDYREMARLSGGSQVSLLLSLLLETDDDRPLVIDQPEEELDKAYLFDVVLPALRRLKGLRQILFVTHDANIVVNGDADQVVYLRADSDRGWVEADGAIETDSVRAAILTVLDGGEAAFELRSRKYGF